MIFDFGGTLVGGKLDVEAYRQRLLDYIHGLGHRVSERFLRRAIDGMLATLRKAQERNRELRFEELYSRVLLRLGINPTEEVLDQIYELYKRSYLFETVPGTEEILQGLYGRYKLAIVSNATSQLPRFALKKSGLIRFFQVVVVSRDLGVRKPDPEIFRYALERLKVRPEEAIHVGDSMKHDVKGAKKAGIKVVWIKTEGEEVTEEPDHVIKGIAELPRIISLHYAQDFSTSERQHLK